MTNFVPRHEYHSAHDPAMHSAPAADNRFELGRSVAFVHDITTGLAPEFADCDVLYSEPPWQQGMATYNERAGAEVPYKALLASMAKIADESTVPVIYVTGTHALKSLPGPDAVIPMQLNRWAAVAVMYHSAEIESKRWGTNTELLVDLGAQFDRVGDFFCGYGKTLRMFHQAGKTFVGSDYNPECIGYIAEHAPSWKR
jgi:hypothetical protein